MNLNAKPRRRRSVIATHLIHTLYGHWGVNDPRGSGSRDFIDLKFAPLGSIHPGRKPVQLQPSKSELREYHREHAELLNFPILWVDDAMRSEIAHAVEESIRMRGYTCYACAICSNHLHLVIRTHCDKAQQMWQHFSERIRERLRLRFTPQISPHHPIISARPYNVLLYTPEEVRGRIEYVRENPIREGLAAQSWNFVTRYDGFPCHKKKNQENAKPPGAART